MTADAQLVECFREVFPTLTVDDIRIASVRRLGMWDSAALLRLLVRVEREFGMHFETAQINTFTSFDAILAAVQSGGDSRSV